jgi:hypothetical protein
MLSVPGDKPTGVEFAASAGRTAVGVSACGTEMLPKTASVAVGRTVRETASRQFGNSRAVCTRLAPPLAPRGSPADEMKQSRSRSLTL